MTCHNGLNYILYLNIWSISSFKIFWVRSNIFDYGRNEILPTELEHLRQKIFHHFKKTLNTSTPCLTLLLILGEKNLLTQLPAKEVKWNQNNVCFKKTGTKHNSNTLLRFVPVFLKHTLSLWIVGDLNFIFLFYITIK